MSAPAIVLMVLAIAVLWGGLVVATWFLVKHPMRFGDDEPDDTAPGARDRQ